MLFEPSVPLRATQNNTKCLKIGKKNLTLALPYTTTDLSIYIERQDMKKDAKICQTRKEMEYQVRRAFDILRGFNAIPLTKGVLPE